MAANKSLYKLTYRMTGTERVRTIGITALDAGAAESIFLSWSPDVSFDVLSVEKSNANISGPVITGV